VTTREFDRVLVVGCGYVGSAFAKLIAASGKIVWGVKRTPQEIDSYPFYFLDILEPDSLTKLPKNIENVIYAISPSGGSEAEYRKAYIEGVFSLSKYLKANSNCKRFILTSSTGAYEVTDGSWVDEETVFSSTLWKTKVLHEAESQVKELWPDSCSVRFGGIYGPGRTRMIQLARDGEVSFDMNFPRYTNRIHRDDCAGFLMHLLSMSSIQALYNGVDSDPSSRKELFTWVANSLNVEQVKHIPLSEEQRAQLGQGKRCRNNRLLDSGYKLLYPSFREGYAAQLSLI